MKFKDLEYLALEGGGGKGAVYKGAINALEKLMHKEWIEDRAVKKNKDGSALKATLYDKNIFKSLQDGDSSGAFGEMTYPSILDYYDPGNLSPKIKGIAGASAGSITAFALSLGLTSTDIDTILKSYAFNEELLSGNALSEGKYRMAGTVNGNIEFLIAEDDDRKLGGSGIEKMEFSFTKKRQTWLDSKTAAIGTFENPFLVDGKIRIWVRHTVVNVVISVILSGVRDFWAPLKKVIGFLKTTVKSFQLKFMSWVADELDIFIDNQKAAGIANNLVSPIKILLKKFIKWFGKDWLVLKIIHPDKITPSISNLLWDRGVYSGFEIRDFFANMMLYSIYKKTRFRKQLVDAKFENITEEYLAGLGLTFDDSFKPGLKGDLQKIQKVLKMNFEEFFGITGINLVITVTNSTTSQPVYFSQYFTPDFTVLEAVGASMSFPLAFKPLYNEADVVKYDKLPKFVTPFTQKEGNVLKLQFTAVDYNKGLTQVFQHINKTCGLGFPLNGNLSFRSYLPYLRALIVKEQFGGDPEMPALCYFYYNACFKGQLNDGGQTDNIPQRIFALSIQDAKTRGYTDVQTMDITEKVLALKLDNDYPQELLAEVDSMLKKDKEGKLLEKLRTLTQDRRISDANFHFYWIRLISRKIKLRKNIKCKLDVLPDNKNIYEKISKELYRQYEHMTKGFTPWNKQQNAIIMLSTALQFGFDQGSIDNIGLNNNIVSLYCYGLSTFTFDLDSKDISELVKYANEKSEETVLNHFGPQEN